MQAPRAGGGTQRDEGLTGADLRRTMELRPTLGPYRAPAKGWTARRRDVPMARRTR